MTEFSPYEAIVHTLKTWRVVFALIVVGGLAGWGVSLLRPPVYEARTVLTANVDATQTGTLEELELDRLQLAVGNLIGSLLTRQRVAEAAQTQGIAATPETLADLATLERRQSQWAVIIRHPDPRMAQTLATLWGAQALRTLDESRARAAEALTLQNYQGSLALCTAGMVSCVLPPLAELEAQSAELTRRIEEELTRGHGLIAAMVFGGGEPARLPTEPLNGGRNARALAGAVLGFLAGVMVVNGKRRDA